MEAVPRLPMISFQLKVSPEPTAFGPKLKQYIRDFYNEDPESYSNEIHQLENLRAMAVRPQIAVTGCSLLQKYYCQLHFLQSRFPMGADEAAAVTFTWKDTYANMVCSLANIRFEIMSILYNIGAVHTQLGARTERTTAEGMKMACSHFQWAAWAFEHLQSNSNLSGLDLAPELMTFMHQLSLAQAQECILEKSMLDNRKPTIVAKVAKQIVDYYSQALGTLEPNSSEDNAVSDTVGSKIYKNWKRYVKFKRAYHLAVTQLYQGLAAEEQQKMGERVAFYNASLAALNDARSMYASAKGAMGITGVAGEKEAIEEALTFTNDVIEGKRKAAKNENEFIYHEEVPEKDVLPTVNGASLVKGIPFSVNDPEVSGPDIFARLVPMKVHEASSLYSEEKAKILRSIGAKIDERDQHLEAYLASLKLQHLSLWDPDAQTPESEFLPLPEELAERCAALNARPTAIQDLVDIMGKLSDTYRDVESMLKEIDTLLTEEEQREKRYQEAMGKRPPTIVATDLTREAKKYEEAHAKASESNQALHRAMTLHVNNLQVLAQPLADLAANIPSPSANSSGQKTDSETDKANARELKRILGKVDEMQRQRNDLHAKLRDSIAQDDLTRLLVTATAESSSLETLFSEQISKHHALVSLIEQNLSAQDNVLAALTDAYARTADTRKAVDEILKRRELTISSLITSYDAYEDLLAKSTKGLEFYRKLEVNVTKLLQRVKSTCRVQEEEREQILRRNDKAAAYGAIDAAATVPAAPPTTERKPGSGMKLRDHLAARLKSNSPASYQQGHYGADRGSIPVAPVQPNSHGTAKTYPLDSTGSDASSGIPVHTVPPVAVDNASQQMYQQYYPNDYANYYMAQQQQQQQQQHQYPPHQYQYGETASLTNGGGTLSFPKTGTTNTDSMYRQASGHAIGTEVSSNSSRYAGYAAADQATYDSADYGAQYAAKYGYQPQSSIPGSTAASYGGYQPQGSMPGASVGSTGGYQPQSSMPAASVGSTGGYQPQSSMPAASAGSTGGYQPQSSMPAASAGSTGGYQPQSSMPAASAGSTGGYQPQSSMPAASAGSTGGYQPQSSMPAASAGSTGGYQPQSSMPAASAGSTGGYQPQSSMPASSAGSTGGYQPQSSIPPSSAGSTGGYQSAYAQPGYSHTGNAPTNPANNQSPSHVQQPGQIQPQAQSAPHQPQQQPYDAAQSYANPYQVVQQQQPQMPQPTGSPATHSYSAVPPANPQSNQHLPHVPPSNSPYAINDQYTQQQPQQQQQQNPGIPGDNSSMYPTGVTGVYYGSTAQTPNASQLSTDYASQNQPNYVDPGAHSAAPTAQPVQSYPSTYANYQPDASGQGYPDAVSSRVGSSGGSVGYANGADMIQSHARSTSSQGYLRDYRYPVQGHNASVAQYPSYSQGYGNGYSQAAPTVQASMTDSYKGHPGYVYDPASRAYSYSSGYQDSQNGTAEGTSVANVAYAPPPDGQAVQPVYSQQDNASRYTNASNGTATSLTPSSQYSNGSYQTPSLDHSYYTTAYGAQSQNEVSTASNNDPSASNAQSYRQGPAEATKTATSRQPEATPKPANESRAPKSNLDLLAELDVAINHAPLVPEVHSVDRTQKDATVPVAAPPPEKTETRKNSLDVTSQHIEDKHENLQIVWDTWYTDVQPKRDPLGDPAALQKFLADIEKYEKFVESLTVKTLSGSTNLDIKWSEISDVEEREAKKQTSYVAQAHASANRTTNLVPYDSTRVRLSASNLSSDYVNASHVNDLTQWTPAAFIVAQAPKPESYEAFWTMIWEQGSEVIACLATDAQLNDEIYWPTSKENNLTIGSFTLSLKNATNHTYYAQRVISVMHSERRIERMVVHMQYLVWPSTGLPSSPGSLLSFATDILSEQALRHCSPKPIVVHCLLGGSLSGLFLLAAAAVCHVRAGQGAVNVPLVLSTLVKYRRCMIDRDSLLFGYRMVLYHAQDTLMKRGILSSTRSTFECFESMKGNKARAMKKPHHPSDDFLHNLGVGMQHGIARQQEHSIGQTGSQTKTEMVSQKTDKIDPLSQLDPLWSIRR